MSFVKVYTTTFCPYCIKAKGLLNELGVDYDEVDLGKNDELRQEIIQKHNWMTVPVVIAGDQLIGGYNDMVSLHAEGKLLDRLKG